MFLGMQDFDFAQIQSNFFKSNNFLPNFAAILSKFCLYFAKFSTKFNEICPNMINFCLNNFCLEDVDASPAPTALL